MSSDIELAVGDPADFVVFGNKSASRSSSFRSRNTTQDLVYDAGQDRITIFNGLIVSRQ
jgi:hypothetical protein